MHAYASTTSEARELVSELEFVWDQIKSNTASSSSASSPEHLGLPSSQSRSRLQLKRSHEDISRKDLAQRPGAKEETFRSGHLRILRPISEPDEGENADDDGDRFEEARSSPPPTPSDPKNPVDLPTSQGRDYDVRNRKWRKRIEAALVKMTAEVAALRELMEARGVFDGRPRGRVWTWVMWMVWAALRHVLVDAAILGLLYMWFRGKDDQRLEQGIKLLGRALADRGKRTRGWRRIKGGDA